jgi:hypothetical protein
MKFWKQTNKLFFEKYVNKVSLKTSLSGYFRGKRIAVAKHQFLLIADQLEKSGHSQIQIGNAWNKKFAKYIVQAVCMLAEKGFGWWTTKDISESKVVEYELNGEMDLSILLTMQNGQKATVKQWFQSQRFKSEELGKYDKNEIEDLSDALAEVLDKKGVSPTEEQELMIIAASVFGSKLMAAIEIKRDIGNVIHQLKEIQQSGAQAPRQDYSETVDYSQAEQEQVQPEVVETQPEEEKHSVISDIEGNFGGITDLVTT